MNVAIYYFQRKKNCQRNEETSSAFMKKKLLLILAFLFLSDTVLPTFEGFPFTFNEPKPSPAIYYKVYFFKNTKYSFSYQMNLLFLTVEEINLDPLNFSALTVDL